MTLYMHTYYGRQTRNYEGYVCSDELHVALELSSPLFSFIDLDMEFWETET
jgi:hypothetical protein